LGNSRTISTLEIDLIRDKAEAEANAARGRERFAEIEAKMRRGMSQVVSLEKELSRQRGEETKLRSDVAAEVSELYLRFEEEMGKNAAGVLALERLNAHVSSEAGRLKEVQTTNQELEGLALRSKSLAMDLSRRDEELVISRKEVLKLGAALTTETRHAKMESEFLRIKSRFRGQAREILLQGAKNKNLGVMVQEAEDRARVEADTAAREITALTAQLEHAQGGLRRSSDAAARERTLFRKLRWQHALTIANLDTCKKRLREASEASAASSSKVLGLERTELALRSQIGERS